MLLLIAQNPSSFSKRGFGKVGVRKMLSHLESSCSREHDVFTSSTNTASWIHESLVLQVFPTVISQSVSSVTQSCRTLCNPMNHSTPSLPAHHQCPESITGWTPVMPSSHPAISSSVVPFSSCPQSLPASKSFPMSQLFT